MYTHYDPDWTETDAYDDRATIDDDTTDDRITQHLFDTEE